MMAELSDIKKLGIVAGRGAMPTAIIQACKQMDLPFVLAVLKGHGEEAIVHADKGQFLVARMDRAGAFVNAFKEQGVSHVVMAGGVKAPPLSSLRPDWRVIWSLTRIGLQSFGKDDRLLSAINSEISALGFTLIPAHAVVPGLLVQSQAYSFQQPSSKDWRDIQQGWAIAKTLGQLDVGQGCVVQNGFTLGIEAIEGTDAMIARAGGLRKSKQGGVLVKVSKPQQDRRVDLPTIGPKTIEGIVDQGLAGVALEVGSSYILEAEEVARLADDNGIFVIGVSSDRWVAS